MVASQGLYLVIEGLDGAGTTTQTKWLADWYRAKGRAVLAVREPTDKLIGQHLRQRLRGEIPAHRLTDHVLALLFAADRLDLYVQTIEPALAEGTVVISDRNFLSSLAYQPGLLTEDLSSLAEAREWVLSLNQLAPQPDILFYLDVPVETGLSRVSSRNGTLERFEITETLKRAQDGYAEMLPLLDKYVVIDGTLPVEKVFDRITYELEE